MGPFKPQDIIAAILLIGAFTLRGLGYNSFMEALILGVALTYGVIQLPLGRK